MARETEEFASIFNEVYPGLCRFLNCMMAGAGGPSAPEDIAQESFLKLHREGLARFGEGEARFWLFRVARNMALNELNRGRTRHRLLDRVVEALRPGARDPQSDYERAERGEILTEMLKRLPEQQRAALLLREQEGMGYREIAEVLGVSEGKVKVDVFRARSSLRERWARTQEAAASEGKNFNGLPKLVL